MASNVTVDSARCLRQRLRGFNCSQCVESCRAEAISICKAEIHVNGDACTNCGRCVAVCPSEVFTFSEDYLYQVLQEFDLSQLMVISCKRQKDATAPDITVPCLGTLPFEAFLFLALRQQNDIIINMAGCADCENSHITIEVKSAITRIEQLQLPKATAKFITTKNTSEISADTLRTRRSFLVHVGSNVLSLVRDRVSLRVTSSEPSRPHRRRVPWKTELLLNVIYTLDHEYRSIITKTFLPQLIIQSSCTLCPRCAGICPTGALKRVNSYDTKTLIFLSEKCTGCGLCVEFCHKKSLELNLRY